MDFIPTIILSSFTGLLGCLVVILYYVFQVRSNEMDKYDHFYSLENYIKN